MSSPEPPAEIRSMLDDTAIALSRVGDFWTPVRVSAPGPIRRDGQWCVGVTLELEEPPQLRWTVVLLLEAHRVGGDAEWTIHDDLMELVDAAPGIEAGHRAKPEIIL
jgi:hypothetical protein